MSNIYIQEPPSNGKVLLKTSIGDIDIELWSKEAPKACRNFVQLCLEGYYNNTIFHRVVKGFIAQGGDPTGTGTGGESIYGKPFKDEFHQRLKFNRRGLVAMANAGKDDNASQFFFTLDRTEELNKKHTIFGKVGGNTIYNMIRFNDLEIDEDDRPLSPPKILKTEVLYNPFDDIEARKKANIINEVDGEVIGKDKKIKSKSKATKNYKLLSFGEEAEEDEEETVVLTKEHKVKSSHDVLADPKFISSQSVVIEPTTNKRKEEDEHASDNVRKKLKKDENSKTTKPLEDKSSDDDDDDRQTKKNKRRKALQEEARQLKKDIKAKDKVVEEVKQVQQEEEKEEEMANDLMKQLVEERKQFLKNKKENKMFKKGGDRESQTLALLAGFETKIHDIKDDEDDIKPAETSVEDEDSGWMSHKLNFEDSEQRVEERAKDANMKDNDWYDIYDPRNPLNQRRREASKKETKKRR